MTYLMQRSRVTIGVLGVLMALLVAAVVIAAMTVRAGNHDSSNLEIIGGELEMYADGNTFPDEFRTEYRLKFGDPDNVNPGSADENNPNRSDARETFARFVNDGSNVYIGQLTFQPEQDGEVGGVDWHTHPGPFIVAVTEGALTITWEHDCEPRTYEAGEAFVDLGQNVHKAENLSGEETVVHFSVIGVPEGEPITQVQTGADDFEAPC
jgi:hypothetical protein